MEGPVNGGEKFSELRLLSDRCREGWGLVIDIVRGGGWRGSQPQAQTMHKASCCTRDESQFINYRHNVAYNTTNIICGQKFEYIIYNLLIKKNPKK